MQKFRQSSTVFEKPGILSKKMKIWRAQTTVGLSIFCWSFAHIPLTNVYKMVSILITKFCLDLELFIKIKKDLVSTYLQKPGFFTFF